VHASPSTAEELGDGALEAGQNILAGDDVLLA
jgi:hypothetical protein